MSCKQPLTLCPMVQRHHWELQKPQHPQARVLPSLSLEIGWFLGYPKSIPCRLRGKQPCSNRCRRPVVVAAEYLPMLFCIPTACSVPHTVATNQEGRVGATTLQITMLLALQGGETALEKALPQWCSSSSSLAWSRNLLLSLRLGSRNQSWTQRLKLDSPWDPNHSVPVLCYAHKPKARSWGKSL